MMAGNAGILDGVGEASQIYHELAHLGAVMHVVSNSLGMVATPALGTDLATATSLARVQLMAVGACPWAAAAVH
jgi:hypothetical protein